MPKQCSRICNLRASQQHSDPEARLLTKKGNESNTPQTPLKHDILHVIMYWRMHIELRGNKIQKY